MTIVHRALALSLALAPAPALLLAAAGPASAQPGPQVDGRTVTFVQFDRGSFRQQGDSWVEYDINNRPIFTFDETHRDDWSVYLVDRSRNVRLQLDLHRRKVGYAEGNGRMSDLYDIVSVSGPRLPNTWPFRDLVRPRDDWAQSRGRRWVNAGPIWNQQDARVKCPVVAYAVDGRWTGQWRTTRQGRMSVCEIDR